MLSRLVKVPAKGFPALKASFSSLKGSLFTWGEVAGGLGREYANSNPQPAGLEGVTRVSMGYSHTAAIDERGNLYTFGHSAGGALGNGETDNEIPRAVNFFEHTGSAQDVDCGRTHTVVCTKDGEVFTWGSGWACGGKSLKTPTRVSFADNAVIGSVGAGNSFSVAVSQDGEKLYVWGQFNSVNEGSPVAFPIEAESVTELLHREHTTIKRVKVCEGAVAILGANGKLYVWGDNKYGQLGNNQMKGRSL